MKTVHINYVVIKEGLTVELLYQINGEGPFISLTATQADVLSQSSYESLIYDRVGGRDIRLKEHRFWFIRCEIILKELPPTVPQTTIFSDLSETVKVKPKKGEER